MRSKPWARPNAVFSAVLSKRRSVSSWCARGKRAARARAVARAWAAATTARPNRLILSSCSYRASCPRQDPGGGRAPDREQGVDGVHPHRGGEDARVAHHEVVVTMHAEVWSDRAALGILGERVAALRVRAADLDITLRTHVLVDHPRVVR